VLFKRVLMVCLGMGERPEPTAHPCLRHWICRADDVTDCACALSVSVSVGVVVIVRGCRDITLCSCDEWSKRMRLSDRQTSGHTNELTWQIWQNTVARPLAVVETRPTLHAIHRVSESVRTCVSCSNSTPRRVAASSSSSQIFRFVPRSILDDRQSLGRPVR